VILVFLLLFLLLCTIAPEPFVPLWSTCSNSTTDHTHLDIVLAPKSIVNAPVVGELPIDLKRLILSHEPAAYVSVSICTHVNPQPVTEDTVPGGTVLCLLVIAIKISLLAPGVIDAVS
jgi:hypothetical protein